MPNASATVTTSAAPETVFRHLAVAEAWPVWMRLPVRARRTVAGTPDPNGLGAVRLIFPIKERVVAYEPSGHYAYVMINISPIKGYRADVRLTPKDGGTQIEYAAVGDPAIPAAGALVGAGLRFATRTLAKLLAAHTAKCRPGCPAH
ncbi:SRPBCC family protein [Actinocorallia lasiicapitis]